VCDSLTAVQLPNKGGLAVADAGRAQAIFSLDVQKETAFAVVVSDDAESNTRVACTIHQSGRDGRKEILTVFRARGSSIRRRDIWRVTARTGLRVFVVDDEEIIAATVATILEMNGFSATAFTSPSQALNCARLESPDLLISDVRMPEMSGIDLALRIKEECPNCKILLFSGQAATRDLLWKARNLGHNFQLLSKPIHPTDLLCEVRIKLKQRTAPMEVMQGL